MRASVCCALGKQSATSNMRLVSHSQLTLVGYTQKRPCSQSIIYAFRDDGHPCKFLSTEKHRIFWARSGERAIGLIRICRYATVPLGWWFLLSAEPDIHLLSETPKSPHRRLSLCSLPVPKQTEGSLWSCLRRSARHLRDLAACAPNDPDVFPSWGGFTQRQWR
jgi:hypothetical protein